MQVMMPFITSGLETVKSPALQSATRMVVSQLVAHTKLDAATTTSLVESVACTLDEASAEDALKCLVVISQTQHLAELPAEAFHRLAKVNELPARLDALCREFEAGKLLRLLVEAVLGELDQHRGNEELLLRIVQDVKISAKLAKAIGLTIATRLVTCPMECFSAVKSLLPRRATHTHTLPCPWRQILLAHLPPCLSYDDEQKP